MRNWSLTEMTIEKIRPEDAIRLEGPCLSEYGCSLDSVSSLTLLISHPESYNFEQFQSS